MGAFKALEPAPAQLGHSVHAYSVHAYAVSAFGTKTLWRHLSVPLSNLVVLAVDDMGSRIDELEKSIGELMTQAGIEESQPQLTAGD